LFIDPRTDLRSVWKNTPSQTSTVRVTAKGPRFSRVITSVKFHFGYRYAWF